MSNLKHCEYMCIVGTCPLWVLVPLDEWDCNTGAIFTINDPQMFIFVVVDGDDVGDDKWQLLLFKLEIS